MSRPRADGGGGAPHRGASPSARARQSRPRVLREPRPPAVRRTAGRRLPGGPTTVVGDEVGELDGDPGLRQKPRTAAPEARAVSIAPDRTAGMVQHELQIARRGGKPGGGGDAGGIVERSRDGEALASPGRCATATGFLHPLGKDPP